MVAVGKGEWSGEMAEGGGESCPVLGATQSYLERMDKNIAGSGLTEQEFRTEAVEALLSGCSELRGWFVLWTRVLR